MEKPLICIKSCHRHHARRVAQQETWLPGLDWADYIWVIGEPRVVIVDTLSCLVDDGFANIAPKVWCACAHALDHNITQMFVCDDDTYVMPGRLYKASKKYQEYAGFMRTSGLFYNDDKPYAQGSGYWIGERSMEHVVRAGETIMVNGCIDDGAVGRALHGKVPFVHDDRYQPGPEPVPIWLPKYSETITTHKCLPGIMEATHTLVRRHNV